MTTTKRFAALTLGAAFAFAACSSGSTPSPSSAGSPSAAASSGASQAASPSAAASSGEPLSGTIVIDGSSTVLPISEAMAEDFQKANSGVTVTVGESGTGGGFKKFCTGETNISDASRPIKADDAAEGQACTTNGIEYVELTIGKDGITVVVNPQNTWATCMTSDQLKMVYGPDSPKDLTWSQVDASWPNEPVVRYMPGADSGTFDFFTEVINGKTDASTQDATQSEDDNVLASGVAGDKDAIGYFGYSYYAANTDKLKAVEVNSGTGCIGPSPETIADGTYAPLSRPLFIYPNIGDAKESAALSAFVTYYLDQAATIVPEVDYVAVPDAVATAQKAKWLAAIK